MGMFAMRKLVASIIAISMWMSGKRSWRRWKKTPSVTWVAAGKGILARGYTGQIHRRNNSLEAAQGERT